MMEIPLIVKILLVGLVGTAAVYDMRWRRIPNWLNLTGVLAGLALNTALFGWEGLRLAGMGIGLAMLVYFPLYIVRGMGAGDVKLMAAVGALVGPGTWLGIFILTAILGAAIGIVLLLLRRQLRGTLWNVGYILSELMHFRAPYVGREELDVKHPLTLSMPHGATIALGCIAFLAVAKVL
jgi:prepilin peptidase CpaA